MNRTLPLAAIGLTVLIVALVTVYAADLSTWTTDFEDATIVVGSAENSQDIAAATKIADTLGISATTTTTTTGEKVDLYTSADKLFMNDSINNVKNILTDDDLPTILADGEFEGDVSADYTQTITLGSVPRIVFGKHPTSDTDPVVAIQLSTIPSTGYLYNLTVTFNKAVNFTDSDSKGASIK